MKVFDLHCGQGHGFEGWFGSEEDYQGQIDRGLLSCPLCGDVHVKRRPSAPRLNLGARPPGGSDQPPTPVGERPVAGGEVTPGDPAEARQARLVHAVRDLLSHTEDVGTRFAEEARRIHYGETQARAIRGRADAEEREALRDEGIEVFSLPIPPGLDGPLQ